MKTFCCQVEKKTFGVFYVSLVPNARNVNAFRSWQKKISVALDKFSLSLRYLTCYNMCYVLP
jgi:hypothetical protein